MSTATDLERVVLYMKGWVDGYHEAGGDKSSLEERADAASDRFVEQLGKLEEAADDERR